MTRLLCSCALLLYLTVITGCVASPEQEILSSKHDSRIGNNSPTLRRFHLDLGSKRDVLELFDSIKLSGVDVWHVAENHVDVLLTESHDHPQLDLEGSPIPYTDTVLLESLYKPSAAPSESLEGWDLSSLDNSTLHSNYRRLNEIDQFVEDLVREYPNNVNLVSIGHSAEGREMFALEIVKEKAQGLKDNHTESAKKSGFVLTGAQHAREWIATSTAMYLTHALVANESEPFSLKYLLNSFNFYVILVPNPDGYVYTWEYDRFWYKNRQIVGPNEKCVGIDMNRNWGYKWKPVAEFPLRTSDELAKKKKKQPRVPTDPCSHWYPGHRPFESPEVNNIANYITTLPRLRAFVDLRSYGQMISSPYSYNCKRIPKDAEDQVEAAMGAAKAIKDVHGTAYTTGRLCEMLYKAPGNVVDYMFARASIKYAYAAHLRDTGTYGFALPPEWIRPTGEETVNMIKSLARFMTGIKGMTVDD
ncbi:hypothetical protein QCA50_007146 [Cerrena zonata]|uniref:Peptidase M14 domain-containing protein n=1 Tax=Cerrena zonata TaxID=2478898 RepID=A0AAW0G7C4_9APHY